MFVSNFCFCLWSNLFQAHILTGRRQPPSRSVNLKSATTSRQFSRDLLGAPNKLVRIYSLVMFVANHGPCINFVFLSCGSIVQCIIYHLLNRNMSFAPAAVTIHNQRTCSDHALIYNHQRYPSICFPMS